MRQALDRFYSVYLYEHDRARRKSPRDHCRDMIEDCDVFVGLLGASYGSPVGEEEQRSICEWEFDTANQQPDQLEILMFLKDLAPDVQVDSRQTAFREKVSSFQEGVWRQLYRTTPELLQRVTENLHAWALEFWDLVLTRQEQTALLHRRALWVVSAVIACFPLAVGAFYWLGLVSASALIAVCAVAIAALLIVQRILTA